MSLNNVKLTGAHLCCALCCSEGIAVKVYMTDSDVYAGLELD